LIVFVMHPQKVLHSWGVKYAAVQDLKLMAAGKLAKVEMIPDFFQSRHLTTKINFVKLVCSLERQKLEWATSEAVKAAKKRQQARASKLLQMHSRIVLSTFRLRKLLQHYDELFVPDLTNGDEPVNTAIFHKCSKGGCMTNSSAFSKGGEYLQQ
jgi:hypothetical protein